MDPLTPENQLYYLQDKRTFVGNSMVWWGLDRHGYVCDVRDAHVFTKEEAFAQHRSRETDIPWPKDFIDSITASHVDMQRAYKERPEGVSK